MMASIKCKANGKFLVRIHNGGGGLTNHYSKYFSSDDTPYSLYQTAFEIDEVDIKQIFAFIEGLAKLHKMSKSNNEETIYKGLLPKLNGIYLKPSPDQRLWMRYQSGPSCSGYAAKILVKSILSESEYVMFRETFLTVCSTQLKTELESPTALCTVTPMHPLVLKETYIKLFSCTTLSPNPEKLRRDLALIPQPSPLSKWTGRLHVTFWRTALDPHSLFRKDASHQELAMLRSQKMRITLSFMSHPQLYFTLYEIKNHIDTYTFFYMYDLISTSIDRKTLYITLPPLFVEQISKELDQIYRSLDMTKMSQKRINALRKGYEAFQKERRVFMTSPPSTSQPPFKSSGLATFLSELYYVDAPSSSSSKVTSRLSKALTLFQQNRYEEARKQLIYAYKEIEATKLFGLDEMKELMLIQQELANWEIVHRPAPLTTAVSSSTSLEEIELHIAFSVLFEKIKDKVPLIRTVRFLPLENLWGTPLTWRNEYQRYSCLGMSRAFKSAPWKKEMHLRRRAYHKLVHDTRRQPSPGSLSMDSKED